MIYLVWQTRIFVKAQKPDISLPILMITEKMLFWKCKRCSVNSHEWCTHQLDEHNSRYKTYLSILTAATDGLLSWPGGGWVTSAPTIIAGDCKHRGLCTEKCYFIFLIQKQCENDKPRCKLQPKQKKVLVTSGR